MAKPRPLSPHLSVWRFQLPAVLSILHRITGVGLATGTALLALWIMALAAGADAFAIASAIVAHPLGQLVLFGYSIALSYHLCNGIRHLFWDMGYGLDMPSVYTSGRLTVLATVLLTVGLWLFVYLR